MISSLETLVGKQIEKHDPPIVDESLETKELNNNIEDNKESHIDPPDITYIERTSRPALILMERFLINAFETNDRQKQNQRAQQMRKSPKYLRSPCQKRRNLSKP